jgi:hypothetical protein
MRPGPPHSAVVVVIPVAGRPRLTRVRGPLIAGTVRGPGSGSPEPSGVGAAFHAIGGVHFARAFACLAFGGLVGYGSQTMADGREALLSARLGSTSGARSVRPELWPSLPRRCRSAASKPCGSPIRSTRETSSLGTTARALPGWKLSRLLDRPFGRGTV